ncbi:MAG: DoxX family protein [Chloroflexota bacterium]|nr:DoxX family protein [Chloroflexota bacterium]
MPRATDAGTETIILGKTEDRLKALGLLTLRLAMGGLLAGHGAQKLFGSFGGFGLQGTSGFLESMGHKPGWLWASAAGGSEFGGGVLTALGFLSPIGPISTVGAMGMATLTVHRGKPIWVTEGGAELPVVYMGIATALSLLGPGRYSLDRALGIRLPRWVAWLAAGATGAGIAYGLAGRSAPAQSAADTQLEATDELEQEVAVTAGRPSTETVAAAG